MITFEQMLEFDDSDSSDSNQPYDSELDKTHEIERTLANSKNTRSDKENTIWSVVLWENVIPAVKNKPRRQHPKFKPPLLTPKVSAENEIESATNTTITGSNSREDEEISSEDIDIENTFDVVSVREEDNSNWSDSEADETACPVESSNQTVAADEAMTSQDEGISKSMAEAQVVARTMKYTCNKCHASFSYLTRFENHMSKSLCDNLECEYCEKTFISAKTLKQHKKIYHNGVINVCAVCSKSFVTVDKLASHFSRTHSRECKHCKKTFKNSNTLRSHLYDKCKAKPTKKSNSSAVKGLKKAYSRDCLQCNRVFTSKGGYFKHIKSHRSNMEVNN